MSGSAAVAVQLVNYHTRAYLERCLPTVVADLQRSAVDFELNLLDNASGEELSDLAARFPGCRAFTSERNLGFGGGHNLLARQTAAPNLLIVNPDVEFVIPDTVARLLELVAAPGPVVAAGPKVIMGDGTAQPYDHGRLHGVRAEIALRGGHSYWRETYSRLDVAWVSGAVLIVRRAAFDAGGGFDEGLFLYKEDEDLCLRLRQAGGRVVYEPAIVVRHRGEAVADKPVELARAIDYYTDKHFAGRRTRKVYAAVHQGLAYLGA